MRVDHTQGRGTAGPRRLHVGRFRARLWAHAASGGGFDGLPALADGGRQGDRGGGHRRREAAARLHLLCLYLRQLSTREGRRLGDYLQSRGGDWSSGDHDLNGSLACPARAEHPAPGRGFSLFGRGE